MNQTIRKIWNLCTTLLVTALVVLAVLLVGVRLVGLQPYTVLSGSMEPTYHVGALIYVKEADAEHLTAGTPITFYLNANTVATHRIHEVTTDETGRLAYRTKGDANEDPDGALVYPENIIGTPVGTIPGLGYLVAFLQQPSGRYLALAVTAGILLAVFLPDLLAVLLK